MRPTPRTAVTLHRWGLYRSSRIERGFTVLHLCKNDCAGRLTPKRRLLSSNCCPQVTKCFLCHFRTVLWIVLLCVNCCCKSVLYPHGHDYTACVLRILVPCPSQLINTAPLVSHRPGLPRLVVACIFPRFEIREGASNVTVQRHGKIVFL